MAGYIMRAARPAHSPERDPSTLSNYYSFSVTHTTLDFAVDFDSKSISGSVVYDLTAESDISAVVLDSAHLHIASASVDGAVVPHAYGKANAVLGTPLVIDYSAAKGRSFQVTVKFSTTDKCTAIQFLDKEATDGKKAPYLFSQCQAIHARSLFPCFDTPATKSVFKMSTTSPYPCVMSGREAPSSDPNVYRFDQPIPIPSYLVSVASGDISSLSIGPRSKVFSEPTNLHRCQHEFEDDMENFIQAAEQIVFEYDWKTYNALVLPSSFPYGGMEHPNMTFATPTIVTGDRENIDVIAHELAHSWAGNLVTNCSWEHFWLNEGWCVYLERRIVGSLHGEATRHFSAIIGWADLENSIKAMGESASRFSTLVQDLKDGTDPDDSFSTVPYEKGSTLLYHIEQVVGGKEVFDPFIPYYFNKFRHKSLDTYQFMDTLYEFFGAHKDKLDSIDWDTWLYTPGMPPVKPNFDTTLVDQCYNLADKWYSAIVGKHEFGKIFKPADIEQFSASQSIVFLETMIAFDKHEGFSWRENQEAVAALDEIYGSYAASENPEVVFRWFLLQVGAENQQYYQRLGNWLGTVGRMKFVRPGFTLLNKVDHKLAIEFFRKFESGYHPICRAMVKKDLGLA